MPKSNVYEPVQYGRDVETGVVAKSRPRRVSIGWSKEGYGAQLGVGWTEPVTDPGGDVNRAGTAPDMVTSTEADEAGTIWYSQWIDLDRHTINELIRALRKARDEAFGRDE